MALQPVDAYLFYGEGCPHCLKLEKFLAEQQVAKPHLQLHQFEIYYHQENLSLAKQVAKNLGSDFQAVPFLVIGDKFYLGYVEGVTDVLVSQRIDECSATFCPDETGKILKINSPNQTSSVSMVSVPSNTLPVKPIVDEPTLAANDPSSTIGTILPEQIELPLVGVWDLKKASLPLLTVVLGLLDGFNPCAMWALIFLISLLLGVNDKQRRWFLGLSFIVTSAVVYFIFMSAWLNVFLLLGYLALLRILIGVVAILGATYNLKSFFAGTANTCQVTDDGRRLSVLDKMKTLVLEQNLWLSFVGIVGLAIVVNLVELICSAGLPAIYTQVLSMNQMIGWHYYLYLLVYVFFFMLDDLLVFFTAMFTLELVGVTGKYARYSKLFGGLLMLLIGCLLVFKPAWLMFG